MNRTRNLHGSVAFDARRGTLLGVDKSILIRCFKTQIQGLALFRNGGPQRSSRPFDRRRDGEQVIMNVSEDTSTLRVEIDRAYDFGKCFINLFATMVIGVMTPAFVSLFRIILYNG